ncbi:hypothetical protein BDK51DRAFT_50195 [Blyttiomyces helicus]|uniref:F-box domain-containing protein n=1 Tax=Blyttiomyces helicus TaxID=388810 RepID=A0A4P9VY30_9FUNG|nr:hypothetical protein BDK51DRAFT_50195 [Blyttiomyces helicus]|eukprot:RKO83643.1 hypothetical protein BDK51DRAFT_50195 [Blyttiomyces helicus]
MPNRHSLRSLPSTTHSRRNPSNQRRMLTPPRPANDAPAPPVRIAVVGDILRVIFVQTREWGVSDRALNLATFMRVSKLWHACAAEVLWRVIDMDIDTSDDGARGVAMLGPVLASLRTESRMGELIRKLVLRDVAAQPGSSAALMVHRVAGARDLVRPLERSHLRVGVVCELVRVLPAPRLAGVCVPLARRPALGFWDTDRGARIKHGISRLRDLKLHIFSSGLTIMGPSRE